MQQEALPAGPLPGDYLDKVVQALILDGAVDSCENARPLADGLIAAHAEHLPQFRRDIPKRDRRGRTLGATWQ